MKKLFYIVLFICLAVNNAAGMGIVKSSVLSLNELQESVHKKLVSLPHNVKIGAGVACNVVSGMGSLFAIFGICKCIGNGLWSDNGNDLKLVTMFGPVCVITGYLGHQIYKHAYTHEAQLAQEKARTQRV